MDAGWLIAPKIATLKMQNLHKTACSQSLQKSMQWFKS